VTMAPCPYNCEQMKNVFFFQNSDKSVKKKVPILDNSDTYHVRSIVLKVETERKFRLCCEHRAMPCKRAKMKTS
jgi:hypothetical protein